MRVRGDRPRVDLDEARGVSGEGMPAEAAARHCSGKSPGSFWRVRRAREQVRIPSDSARRRGRNPRDDEIERALRTPTPDLPRHDGGACRRGGSGGSASAWTGPAVSPCRLDRSARFGEIRSRRTVSGGAGERELRHGIRRQLRDVMKHGSCSRLCHLRRRTTLRVIDTHAGSALRSRRGRRAHAQWQGGRSPRPALGPEWRQCWPYREVWRAPAAHGRKRIWLTSHSELLRKRSGGLVNCTGRWGVRRSASTVANVNVWSRRLDGSDGWFHRGTGGLVSRPPYEETDE